ncbi:MAG: UDP-N-acetylglucosamine 2-epimerase (non-hydrolyzing) [Dehalococcoidia bacterium]
MPAPLRVMTLFGTRPEAIKLAPVVRALAAAPWVEPVVAVTGQHREMLDQVVRAFAITPDIDLDLMRHGQGLPELAARAIEAIATALRRVRPNLLLVQGDTTSAFAGALAGFYEGVAVGHVEAGLRSFSRTDPFPEEINRRLISVTADLHFAPTERARRHLLNEGVPESAVTVTGNTVIDALLSVTDSAAVAAAPEPPGYDPAGRLLLVTLHRRESWGEAMMGMCGALRAALDRHDDLTLLFPMHRNPTVRTAVTAALGEHPRAHLVEPLDYIDFVKAMLRCHLIVTDLGGIQEEAPALGKPVLVLRETTSGPEAVEAARPSGGHEPGMVAAAVHELLTEENVYQGDGPRRQSLR